MSNSTTKFALTIAAVMAMTIYCTHEANAQRGFRIGNVMQAGGGQGFRLGGQRAGMHFGGGQGASIGGQNYGMRFGNGQGARIGVRNYGMQFGGQQGTQIGRFATTPMVAPGTYYYGSAQNGGYAQPRIARGYAQPVLGQPVAQPMTQPSVQGFAAPNVNLNQGIATSNYVEPVAPNGANTQSDIARVGLTTDSNSGLNVAGSSVMTETSSKLPPNVAGETIISTSTIDPNKGEIVLKYPADATDSLRYKVNGSDLTIKPGESVVMGAGQEWNIEFSAGDEFGEREAKLSEAGEFLFEKSETEGWLLVENEAATAVTATEQESTLTNDPAPATETAPASEVVPTATSPATETEPKTAPVIETPTPVSPTAPKTEEGSLPTETTGLPTEEGVVPVTKPTEGEAPAVPANGEGSGN